MESAQWDHCDRVVPHVVTDFIMEDDQGQQLAEISNHHGLVTVAFPESINTGQIIIKNIHTGGTPAAIHRIRCYDQ